MRTDLAAALAAIAAVRRVPRNGWVRLREALDALIALGEDSAEIRWDREEEPVAGPPAKQHTNGHARTKKSAARPAPRRTAMGLRGVNGSHATRPVAPNNGHADGGTLVVPGGPRPVLHARILAALEARGPLWVDEIAAAIGMQRPEVYRALQGMLGDSVALVDLGRYALLGATAERVCDRKRAAREKRISLEQ